MNSSPSSGDATISVIIPVHGGGEGFRSCLSSISAAVPPPLEVIVVIDGSDGSSGQLAAASGAQVVELAAQRGPAAARNVGARHSHGDILFFVDADVLVPADVMRVVAAALQGMPEVAAIFGSYDGAPAVQDFLSQFKNLLHHYVHQTSNEEASTFWAGCGAIRRDAFLTLGGFDERYGTPSIEDIELGYRLRQQGYRVRLCKGLQVKHLKRWTPWTLLVSDFSQRALPWSRLILERGQFINDLNLRTSSRVSVGLAWALAGALVLAPWRPVLLGLAMVPVILLLAVNAPLYRFFLRVRGWRFALKAIGWHWLYYLYAGLAFAIALLAQLRPGYSTAEPVWSSADGDLSDAACYRGPPRAAGRGSSS